jgi:hypothetical protein
MADSMSASARVDRAEFWPVQMVSGRDAPKFKHKKGDFPSGAPRAREWPNSAAKGVSSKRRSLASCAKWHVSDADKLAAECMPAMYRRKMRSVYRFSRKTFDIEQRLSKKRSTTPFRKA